MKQAAIRRPYLANIESAEEMNFVMSLMISKDIKEIYIGANNLIKRSIFKIFYRKFKLNKIFYSKGNALLWERVGVTTEVDKRILCPDIYVDNSSFYCGFVKNMFYDSQSVKEKILDVDFKNFDSKALNSFMTDQNSFCVNVSNCFIHLPYLCEVNCTNQEDKCSIWAVGTNNYVFV